MKRPSRRAFLAAAGSAAGPGLAGCISLGSSTPQYRLTANTVPGSLTDAFRWETRGEFPDADRALMDRLVAEGSLTTAGFALYPAGRNDPTYVERDGTFFRISIEESGTVEREHWILWFDLLDGEPPGDAEVYTSSLGVGEPTDLAAEYGLSERDVHVVEDAAGEIPREFDFHDPEGDPPGRRGHVFLRRDEDETDLLPEPPFTHVAFETNDDTRYAEVVTERATVELQQYRHEATRVADSEAGYADHVREEHLRAAFDRERLPEDQRAVLDAITTGGGSHEEHSPLSDAMKSVLGRLGLDAVETPDPKGVAFSEDAFFEYRDGYFVAQLQIFR